MAAAWVLMLLVIASTMGALIVARRPANLIGRSLVARPGLALQAFTTQYAINTPLTIQKPCLGRVLAANWLTTPAANGAFATVGVSHRSAAVASLARDLALVALLAHNGLRIGEALAAEVPDLVSRPVDPVASVWVPPASRYGRGRLGA